MQIFGLELLALIIAKFVFHVPVLGSAYPLSLFVLVYVMSSLLGFAGMAGIWLIMQGFGVLLHRRIVGPFADWILFDPAGAMGNVYFFLMSMSFAVLWVPMGRWS
jgi:hypothetical protein